MYRRRRCAEGGPNPIGSPYPYRSQDALLALRRRGRSPVPGTTKRDYPANSRNRSNSFTIASVSRSQ